MGDKENKPRIRVVTSVAKLAKVIYDEMVAAGDEAAAADFAKVIYDEMVAAGDEAAAADFAKLYKEASEVDSTKSVTQPLGIVCKCPVCTAQREASTQDERDMWAKRAQEAESNTASLEKQLKIVRAEAQRWKAASGLSNNATKSDAIDALLKRLYEASQSSANSEVIAKMRAMLNKIDPPQPFRPRRNQRGTVLTDAEREARTYIAGPMSGYPEHNFPAFNAAAVKLISQGRSVVNPADHGTVKDAMWGDYLRADIELLMRCTHVYFLKGWEDSQRARLELQIARTLGFTIEFEEGANSFADIHANESHLRRALKTLTEICQGDNVKWWINTATPTDDLIDGEEQ